MKPSLHFFKNAIPEVDEKLIQHHLDRLDERYFACFDQNTIAQHLRALSKISPDNPAELLLTLERGNRLTCTVLAFDYPGEFSLISGVLAGMGVNVQSGGSHTYARLPEATAAPKRRITARQTAPVDLLHRRRIIDHFSGILDTELPLDAWQAEFARVLKEVIGLLEQGQDARQVEAKSRVNELVARQLEKLQTHTHPVLYPVEIEIQNKSGPFTRLKVISQDTPAFLYALSNALSVKGISIEHVRISTKDNRIEDLVDFVDAQGGQITDPALLDQVRLSVLVTKQFTYFLGTAPDPFAALSRFEKLVEDLLRLPEHGKWVELLSSPKLLRDLAQLLGTSDFLWEDMIRLQYETLLPMLGPRMEGKQFADTMETLPERLDQALAGAKDLAAQCQRLNEFKDQEIFLIDLDHILTRGADFKVLSDYLTYLATVVIRRAVKLVYRSLVERYGHPRTVAGLETKYALFGLGKFGGAALGYASDIELMFVYSDNGQTDGPAPLTNAEFFETLTRDTAKFIHAKREGIFNIDLRLRPHGQDGPLAVSLENFANYYSPGGSAHAVERLALVRLRAVGGDEDLGAQIERLRDEFIYTSRSINIRDLRELRHKQFAEKTQGGKLNAKFSPGGLVDLEYDVQILQIMHGHEHLELRTPRIHQALSGLKEVGVLQPAEYRGLNLAYNFLRHLINGLRMLRGSAQDLFLPPWNLDEAVHLARRMGYSQKAGLDPAQQLRVEFEMHTAAIRAFVERHFGRDSLPGPATGTVADLIYSDEATTGLKREVLSGAGFKDADRAYDNLRRLAGAGTQQEKFARLAVLAFDFLSQKPDPDMALNNWERFVGALPDPGAHFESLRFQPMRLEILLNIFSSSQFLADTLVRYPEFLDWATDPKKLHILRARAAYAEELAALAARAPAEAEWLNALRRFRRREFLRIGTRDICLRAPLPDITRELTNLAEALVQTVLDRVWADLGQAGKVPPAAWQDPHRHFCILAFGKMGGQELNYSSDIDLLGVCDDTAAGVRQGILQETGKDPFALAMESVRAYLSQYTEEGVVYRVDLRLRPYGIEGQLVPSAGSLLDYYERYAALSEIQALLKLRPVAGNLEFGLDFMEEIKAQLLRRRDPRDISRSIKKMRSQALLQQERKGAAVRDVKSGLGGLRDIEFLVQGLQLKHAPDTPALLEGNTLRAAEILNKAGFLPPDVFNHLEDDYIFLRRVEHYLQIMEDQQIHALPTQKDELTALAKRMLGNTASAQIFLDQLNNRLKRVHETYLQYLDK